MTFKYLPLSFSFAESTVLHVKVNCKNIFVILNGICLLALNIRVNNLRETINVNINPNEKTMQRKMIIAQGDTPDFK